MKKARLLLAVLAAAAAASAASTRPPNIVLIFAEFIAPGVVIVFFGVGALITALTTWLGWTPDLITQGPVFAASSLLLLFGLRRYLARWFVGNSDKNGGNMDDDFTGREVRVIQALSGGGAYGKVEIKGSEWKACSEVALAAGDLAIIERREGLTLHVRPRRGE